MLSLTINTATLKNITPDCTELEISLKAEVSNVFLTACLYALLARLAAAVLKTFSKISFIPTLILGYFIYR